MAILKRISPGSALKVGLVAYGLAGLVAGVFCSVIALTGIQFAPHWHLPFARTVGLFAIILCPIVYGAIGGIAAALSALIYNLASRWVGGLEVELN